MIGFVPDLTKDLKGFIYADKGYIKQNLFVNLYERGLKMLHGIKKNMPNKLMDLKQKIMLRKRNIIDIYQPYCLHKCQFNLYYFTSIESINFIYFRVINPLFRSISKFKNFINFNTIRMYQPYALS